MKNALIIGSVAAYHWWEDSRKPGDIDLLTSVNITSDKPSVLNVDTQWHEVAEEILRINRDFVFLDPDLLYTLKVSHAGWDVHWVKTIYDVRFMNNYGCRVNQDIHDKLIPVWERVHGKKNISMDQSNETFFNENVRRFMDHDELHELVAFNKRPMHEKVRDDLTNVLCSRVKFNQLTEKQKFQLAAEELIVIALERYIRDSKNSSFRIGISKAFKNLVTTMTKGWFCQYLIENSRELLKADSIVTERSKIVFNKLKENL